MMKYYFQGCVCKIGPQINNNDHTKSTFADTHNDNIAFTACRKHMNDIKTNLSKYGLKIRDGLNNSNDEKNESNCNKTAIISNEEAKNKASMLRPRVKHRSTERQSCKGVLIACEINIFVRLLESYLPCESCHLPCL